VLFSKLPLSLGISHMPLALPSTPLPSPAYWQPLAFGSEKCVHVRWEGSVLAAKTFCTHPCFMPSQLQELFGTEPHPIEFWNAGDKNPRNRRTMKS
jgi:hypothetical protein